MNSPSMIETLEPRRMMAGDTFVQTNLVSDGAVTAAVTDANLQNPWGLAIGPANVWWIADNGTSKTTAYDGTGALQPPLVSIPGGGGADSAPTGVVANTGAHFVISDGSSSGAASYIFVGEDGGITGWNYNVNISNAIMMVDNSATGASYKGVALGTLKHNPILYAANFASGKIEMYNGDFQRIGRKNAFKDNLIPAGYVPFNVQNIGGALAVTYAFKGTNGDDVGGRKHGFVDLFSTSGVLLRRMRRGPEMNSPWGVTIAPATFGAFAGDLLVSMFGSGKIAAYHPKNGKFLGFLKDNTDNPILNSGIWGLSFGNGSQAGSADTLFFTAGLNDEANGLFGKIDVET